MNRRFHELIEMSVEYGFHTHHFASNGYFLTRERLHQLPEAGQHYHITPDFCSDEEFFETYRGTEGSWRTVRDNLRDAIEDPKLSHIQFDVTDISSFMIEDPDELEQRFQALKDLFPKSDRMNFHQRIFHNATGSMAISEKKLKNADGYHLCPYPWFSMETASNGDVVACCRDLEHKTVLGNVFEQSVDEIWNGERYQALRRDLANKQPEKQGACKGCDMPYDTGKFTAKAMAKAAINRMLILEKGN
jgi:radical SAM protein with 4Fe4S-binding SPASM domain